MKVTFEFDAHEDRYELELHTQASEVRYILDELNLWLRNEYKYMDRADSDTLQEVREKIGELDVKNVLFD